MVLEWMWGSSDNDAVKKLDPSLQEVLKNEKDSRPAPASNSSVESSRAIYMQSTAADSALSPITATTQVAPVDAASTPNSRRSEIWKNYVPQKVLEQKAKSDYEKLQDLASDNDDRRLAMTNAALENCIFEQLAETECLKNGTLAQKTMMCRPQKKKFLRCLELQRKMLRALGFWQAVGDQRRMDAIQMHSDVLWQKLAAQEAEIEKAKEEGREIPKFDGILSKENVSSVGGKLAEIRLPPGYQDNDPSYPYPEIPWPLRPEFEKRLKTLPPKTTKEDMAIEAKAFIAEVEGKFRTTDRGLQVIREEGEKRRERYATGQAGLGDYLKKWSGWDEWDSKIPTTAEIEKMRVEAEARWREQQEAKGGTIETGVEPRVLKMPRREG